jgi:hypothetical protein
MVLVVVCVLPTFNYDNFGTVMENRSGNGEIYWATLQRQL